VGRDRAPAPGDVAPARDHAIRRRLLRLHRPLGEMRAAVDAELDEGAGIDEQVDPLAGGELAALVLKGDLLRPTPELRPLAPGVKVLDEPLHPGLLAGRDLGRGLGGLARVLRRFAPTVDFLSLRLRNSTLGVAGVRHPLPAPPPRLALLEERAHPLGGVLGSELDRGL